MDRKDFPVLTSGEEGLRIFADKLNYQDDIFSCQLMISYAFKRQFISQFKRLAQAIVVIIENADTGQYHQMNLNDPHKVYPALEGDNYNASQITDLTGVKTSYREIPLVIELSNPGWGPHLFMHVSLQHFVSNTLALDFTDEPVISSYMNGQPFTINFSDEDNDD